MEVFAYGTLRDRRLLARVLGRPYGTQEGDGYTRAVLPCFHKVKLFGLDWILKKEDSYVRGLVIHNLSDLDMARLDRFESVHTGLYVRRETPVWSVPDQQMRKVIAYVPGPRFWRSLK